MGCEKLNIEPGKSSVLKVVHRRYLGDENEYANYYPFGMEWDTPHYNKNGQSLKPSGQKAKYTYNGKEFVDDLKINLHDYGARYYDPAIARWTSVDPLAEKFHNWSGYNYVLNNPLIFIDPDGRNTVYYDSKGNELHRSEDDFDNAIVIIGDDNLEGFNKALEKYGDAEKAIATLRGFGDNYYVDGIIALHDDNAGNLSDQSDTNAPYQYVDENGETRTDLTAETGAFLEKNGNDVCISDCSFSDGSVDNVSDGTYRANAKSDKIVGTVHTHPNAGERITLRKGGSGHFPHRVSSADRRYTKYLKPGTYNAVVDNKNVYLYNKTSNITVTRKFFNK